MSKVPLPERGQPLDLTYIYQIANALNDLSNQVTSSSNKYTSVDTVSAATQLIKTADTRIVAGYVVVTNTDSNTTESEATFSYNFTDFQYVPIVTATPILVGDVATDASKDVSVVLTSVTTNKVDGVVRFNTLGVSSVGINLIAVGVPV
jgi:hypothetical protein